jgi:hypothetical protein
VPQKLLDIQGHETHARPEYMNRNANLTHLPSISKPKGPDSIDEETRKMIMEANITSGPANFTLKRQKDSATSNPVLTPVHQDLPALRRSHN